MAFFLIVPSVMIVGVLATHALAKRLGLRIYFATLAATAVLSFMVDVAAATFTPCVGKEFLLRLGLLILAASGLLTFANHFLIKQQHAAEKIFHEEVKAAYAAKKESSLPTVVPLTEFEWDADTPPTKYNESVKAEPVTIDEPKDEAGQLVKSKDEAGQLVKSKDEATQLVKPKDEAAQVVKSKDEVAQLVKPKDEAAQFVKSKDEAAQVVKSKDEATQLVKPKDEAAQLVKPKDEAAQLVKLKDEAAQLVKPKDETQTVKPKDETQTVKPKLDDVKNFKPAEKFSLEKAFKPLADVTPEELEKINDAEVKPEPEKKLPLEEVFQPLSEVKQEEVEIPKEAPKPEDRLPLQEVFKPLSMLKLEKLDSLPAEETTQENNDAEPDTLDDILDKAYNERNKGHAWQAIELYRKALERYRNDDYAPFVAIDLGNIYKEQALYSKAIKTFEEALELPAVTRNDEIKREFADNLDYLRVVRDVLLKYHALSVPFAKLTKEILQEIDDEFQKAQRHSEQFK